MRKKILLFFGLAIVGIGVGYFFENLFIIGNCYVDGVYRSGILCEDIFHELAEAIIPASAALSLVFLTLSFVPKAFRAWKDSMLWFMVLAAILFVAYPTGGGPSGFGITGFIGRPASEVYLYTSVLFVVASIASIVLHLLNLTPKQTKILSRSITSAILVTLSWIVFWQ